GLQELHEKSVKYLQARLGESNFAYDKDIVRRIEDYNTEMKFALPLPDNRKELVELLGDEMAGQLESQAGAMARLGVEDVKAKQQEIMNEQMRQMQAMNPYGAEAFPFAGGAEIPQAGADGEGGGSSELTDENGEPAQLCPVCNGSGRVIDRTTGEFKTCDNCKGDGLVQLRSEEHTSELQSRENLV